MNFSDEQLEIINAPINNILVSAAAGSGKTTVLVERIITKILNGDFNIDELLVVTFTTEAADNMRKKISKSLKERLNLYKQMPVKDVDTIRRLKSQLDKLPNAYIQTLNSFCARVIKEKGYAYTDPDTGEMLEPGIPILDENTLGIIRTDAISDALSVFYNAIADNSISEEKKENFILLTQMFGDGRNDDALCQAVDAAFRKLRSIPDYIKVIEDEYKERMITESKGEVYGLENILDDIVECCHSALDSIPKLESMVDDFNYLAKAKDNKDRKDLWHSFLESYSIYLNRVLSVADDSSSLQKDIYDAVFDRDILDDENTPGLPSFDVKRGNDEVEVRTFYNYFSHIAAINQLRKKVFGISKSRTNGYGECALLTDFPSSYHIFFKNQYDELFNMQVIRNKELSAFIALIKETDRCYRKRKNQIHGMDFSDQEHIAYAILSNPQNSDARDFYRDKFVEIYIDEYQDNSKLQDAVIDVFARKESDNEEYFGNVFRVGDVKQSIYKFRYANSKLFSEKMKKYGQKDGGILYLLNKNYRSEASVIDFVNLIFEQLMSEESGTEITYDEQQKLIFNENYDHKHEPQVPNVVFINKKRNTDEEGNEIEYLDKDSVSKLKYVLRQGVLYEALRYLEEGYQPGEICVLTRTNKTALLIADYLNKHNIPAKVVENRELFNDNDIKGITNLILCLANQYRDEYLLGVLLSNYRFSNFTLNDIAEITAICRTEGKDNLYLIDKLAFCSEADSNNDELKKRIRVFMDVFNKLRMQNIMTDIGILIESIYTETGLAATLKAKSDTEAEKLLIFKDFLCQNYLGMGSNIAGVAGYLEQMQLKLTSEVTMKIDDVSENKVRCMTCHSSKGLEFECVILAELDSFGGKDSKYSVDFDADFGFAVRDYINDRYCIQDSLENMVVAKKQKLASVSEDIRLLYVALTRAKSRLSVIAENSVTDKENNNYTLSKYAFLQESKTFDMNVFNNIRLGMGSIFFLALSRIAKIQKLLGDTVVPNNYFCNTELPYDASLDCKYIKPDDIYADYPDLVRIAGNASESVADVTLDEEGNEAESGNDNDGYNTGFNRDNKDTVFFAEELKTSKNSIKLHSVASTSDGLPVFEEYAYEASTAIPFKVSVSQLKNEFEVQKNVSMNLELPKLADIKDEKSEASNAAETGTFVHGIMRYIDLSLLAVKPESFDDETARLYSKGIISDKQMPLINQFREAILHFAQSDVAASMNEAMLRNELYKEKPIVFSIPVGEGNDTDFALVQGVIDAYFIDNDGQAVLIDYKTDNLSKFPDDNARKEEAVRRHKVQLDLYAAALESSGIKVKKKVLYLLRHNISAEFN
ncbi:MAG: UvrD-helicase domain-containing protein [Clostridia bacterium]|nr:UvrD-helicase domain-containing protein [Clostridia bacterium]